MDKIIGNQLNKIFWILLVCFIFPIGGNSPWSVFNVPSNAKDFSLIKSNISEGSMGFYQFTNPALLPQVRNLVVGSSFNVMSLNRSNQVLSINIPLPPQAAVALSMMRSGTSNIQGKDIFNNNTDMISNHEILGMLSFGISFNKYISAGININF